MINVERARRRRFVVAVLIAGALLALAMVVSARADDVGMHAGDMPGDPRKPWQSDWGSYYADRQREVVREFRRDEDPDDGRGWRAR